MLTDAFHLTAELTARLTNAPIVEQMSDIARRLAECFQADSSAISAHVSELASGTYWFRDGWSPNISTISLDTWLSHPQIQHHLQQLDLFQVVDIEILPTSSQLPSGLASCSVLLVKVGWSGVENGLIGLLRLGTNPWSSSDVKGLATVASPIAMAFAHLATVHQVATLRDQVQAITARQNLLDRISAAIRSSLDLTTILQLAIAGVTDLLGGDRGLVLLINYGDPLLTQHTMLSTLNQLVSRRLTLIPSASEVPTREVRPELLPVSSSQEPRKSGTQIMLAAQWCRSDGDALQLPSESSSFLLADCMLCQQAFSNPYEVIAVANVQELLTSHPSAVPNALLQVDRFPALLLVPLGHRGTVLGFLVIQRSTSYPWQPDDLKLAEQVGSQVSTAIIQLQTLRQVRALVEERTSQLCRSLEVQSKLYEVTRRQVAELQALNQVKDGFLTTVNHELRTPLTSMRLAIRMLRRSDLAKDRHDHYVNILEQCCDREIELIQNLLMLQELELKKFTAPLDWIDLVEIVTDLVPEFQGKWRSCNVSLVTNLPQHLYLQSSRDNIRWILTELLTNAGKYAFSNTQVTLTASLDGESPNQQVTITLCNQGHGIAEDELAHVFETFWRGAKANDHVIPGTGLGLALVKGLVDYMQGTIKVTSQPLVKPADRASPTTAHGLDSLPSHPQPYQTCFTIRLPQAIKPY
ncbi:MAG: GAF domain-containing sensor histidine kinase [Cyanobacteria bacterium]|nr:GAF domain-containing sensor histidine kinase [Cyanobacteriota bacterium]